MFNFSSTLFFNKHTISKNGDVSLYLEIYISSTGLVERHRFPLKLKWPHNKVDRKSSVLLPRFKNDPDVNDYNLIIMDARSKYNEIAKVFRLSNKVLTMKAFKRELKLSDPKKSLIKYMEMKRMELYSKLEISEQTFKNIGSTIKAIREYQELVRFEEIDYEWMRNFKFYLKTKNISTSPLEKKYLKPNTIWTRIRDLKAYLAMANEEVSIYVNEEAINFPNPAVATETIYCNRDEIRRLMILLKSGYLTPIQTQVLKAFLFTCFTSLRVSDLYRSNSDWMVSDNLLIFQQHKNRNKKPKTVKIPLIPLAKELISDLNSNFFQLPSEQEYNRTLKDLASMAEINKRITSHVGRHTFGYLYMTTVGNILGLKEIMGHSKLSTTERYSHLDEDYSFKQAMKLQDGFMDLSNKVKSFI